MSNEHRYARHLALPGVGSKGQKKLNQARVLVIGAGGLGSPLLLYLAAAGVGRIGIVDDDVVSLSNLQRQVIHSSSAIGEKKVRSAKRRLEELNDEIQIDVFDTRLTPSNAIDLLSGGWDVVVDGCDNLPTRYLVDDACSLLKLPWVYGSIYRFEGQSACLISMADHATGIFSQTHLLLMQSLLVQMVVCSVYYLESLAQFKQMKSSNSSSDWANP